MRSFTFRLIPGNDLKLGIEKFVEDRELNAASIVSCVGGLKQVNMRMAGATPAKQDIRNLDGHYEIVSLMGTVSKDGSHLHLAVSDSEGVVTGGHLKEGCIVDPTAEVVIGEEPNSI